MSEPSFKLPEVARVGLDAPLRWLGKGWADFQTATLPALICGIVLAGVSAAIAWALVFSGAFAWVFVLAGGFFLIAPILAMGFYEGARILENGGTPQLDDMLLVRDAFRLDLAYLGGALLMIYLLWTRIAQIIYALSTSQLHRTPMDFLVFMVSTPEGMTMALIGTVIGGIVAYLAYSLVVIAAPMLLDGKSDVFIAVITSFRSVTKNVLPMLVWAGLIATLTAIGIATAFFGLIVVFPVIGFASWHAYRELVPASP